MSDERTEKIEHHRRQPEFAVVAAVMKYTGPAPHESDEHHKMIAAADTLRDFEKQFGSRP